MTGNSTASRTIAARLDRVSWQLEDLDVDAAQAAEVGAVQDIVERAADLVREGRVRDAAAALQASPPPGVPGAARPATAAVLKRIGLAELAAEVEAAVSALQALRSSDSEASARAWVERIARQAS